MKKLSLGALAIVCLSVWGCKSISWLPTMSPKDPRQNLAATTAEPASELTSESDIPAIQVPPASTVGTGSEKVAKLTVAGIQPNAGPVRVAVFHSAVGFPQHEAAAQTLSIASAAAQESCNILAGPNVAVAAYQDLNNDGKLNRSSFGIPTEPYGFSRDAKGQMGPPSFDQAAVPEGQEVTLKLSKLSF